MRCGCPECGGFMAQSEGRYLGCVCSDCGYKCTACLGTNTVISKENMDKLKGDIFFEVSFISRNEKEDNN